MARTCRPCKGLTSRRSDGVCDGCGAVYRRPRATSKFCSSKCAAKNRPPPPRGPGAGRLAAGHATWNKGLKNWRVGYRHSDETKQAISVGHLTNGRPRKTLEAYRLRRSIKYRRWRAAVFRRDNYTCQDCGDRSRKGRRVEIQAHHIKGFAGHPELRFDVDNGKTLCRNCHIKTDTFGSSNPRGQRHAPCDSRIAVCGALEVARHRKIAAVDECSVRKKVR